MKTTKLISFLFAFLLGLALNAQDNKEQGKKLKKEKVTFAVNMHCENCKLRIEKNVSWEKGVKDLTVDLHSKTVTIIYNSQNTTEEKLKEAIEKLGYTAETVPLNKEAGK